MIDKIVRAEDLKPGDVFIVKEVRTVREAERFEIPGGKHIICVTCEDRRGEIHYRPESKVELK